MSGALPMVYTPPVVPLDGVDYPMRRLTLADTFTLARLAKEVASLGYTDAISRFSSLIKLFTSVTRRRPKLCEDGETFEVDGEGKTIFEEVTVKTDPAVIITALTPLLGIPEFGQPIEEFFRSVLQLPVEAIIPMGSEVDILEGLAEHEDLQRFFKNAPRLMQSEVLKGLWAMARPDLPVSSEPASNGSTGTTN